MEQCTYIQVNPPSLEHLVYKTASAPKERDGISCWSDTKPKEAGTLRGIIDEGSSDGWYMVLPNAGKNVSQAGKRESGVERCHGRSLGTQSARIATTGQGIKEPGDVSDVQQPT